jgi:toxin ParE1/3/4
MKIHWTETAERHLDAIYAYIARDSEVYALRAIDRITARSFQIASFPHAGKRAPEFGLDQLREVYENPYRIIYYIKPGQVDVLAVIHDARNVLADTDE